MKQNLLRYRGTGVRGLFRLLFVLALAVALGALLSQAADEVSAALYNLMVRWIAPGGNEAPSFKGIQFTAPFAVTGALLGIFVGNLILRYWDNLMIRWEKMDIGDKVTLFLGIFLGLIASSPFLFIFNELRFDQPYKAMLIFGIVTGLAAISVYALQSMADILPWNRGKSRGRRRGIKILDTNVIIDGRIIDVAKAGFLEGELYVPGFVLEELQYIADSHDALRRQRGRRGLDILKQLQSDFPLELRIYDKLAPDQGEEVDARLVKLAKQIGADIITNDWNLNKVAGLQEVRVMNMNDLALAMRPNVLPQESLEITVIREGSQSGQGVGYLDDGTMVVVANGMAHIGETMEVQVTQVIQTERGKMIFAEVDVPSSAQAPDIAPKKPMRKAH